MGRAIGLGPCQTTLLSTWNRLVEIHYNTAVSPGAYEIWRRETLTYVLLRSVLHSYVRRARWSRTTGAVCPTHNDHLVPCVCIQYEYIHTRTTADHDRRRARSGKTRGARSWLEGRVPCQPMMSLATAGWLLVAAREFRSLGARDECAATGGTERRVVCLCFRRRSASSSSKGLRRCAKHVRVLPFPCIHLESWFC